MDFEKHRMVGYFSYIDQFSYQLHRYRWYTINEREDFAGVASFMEPEAMRRKWSARISLKES